MLSHPQRYWVKWGPLIWSDEGTLNGAVFALPVKPEKGLTVRPPVRPVVENCQSPPCRVEECFLRWCWQPILLDAGP